MKLYRISTIAAVLIMLIFSMPSVGQINTDTGKIPITTSSDKARRYFLQGRDLAGKLRLAESRTYFERATAEDPKFALAHLQLAYSQPSTREFFASFYRAKSLVGIVSEGEQLLILAAEAGFNGDPLKQRLLYKQLVVAYPNDEWAHTILGNHYYGRQEYALAIECYQRAIKIDPEFSLPYNMMGYAHRLLENYGEAERAFLKYIELIPDDPNPYDSYAELLLKVGKYNASIEYYQKALAISPDFYASYVGISTNLNLMEKHEEAREQLQVMYDRASNDGQRRNAHFARVVSYVDEGKLDRALKELEEQHSVSQRMSDTSAMSSDLATTGFILLETERYDEARAMFERSVKLIQAGDFTHAQKSIAKRNYTYSIARVILAEKDIATAKDKSREYQKQVASTNDNFQIMRFHELEGIIALAEDDGNKAILELRQANLQNAYNIYRLALAYELAGDMSSAREFCERAANFNQLNSLSYSLIRTRARQHLAAM